MPFFAKKPKTSTQKAQKAQMGIFIRLAACGYLVYIIVQMFQVTDEEDSINPNLKLGIGILFAVAAAVLAAMSVIELVRNYKSGYYKPSAHTDDLIEGEADGADAADELPEEGQPEDEDEDEWDEEGEDDYAD